MAKRNDPNFLIRKNMSKVEYLGRLAEKNRILQQRERAVQEEAEVEEGRREGFGFNFYIECNV